MADLKSSLTLQLVDRVSANARRIRARLDEVGAAARRIATNGQAGGRDERGRFVPRGGLLGAYDNAAKSAGRFTSQLSKSAATAAKFGTAVAGAAGLAGWAFKEQFIDTAVEFERLETVLGVIEGSSEKARQSLDWVTQFAATTPYEINEVSEAFVRMRSYGIQPMNGLLRTVGDAASAMGKPLMQAVEAVADAMTGENERLKEFGIVARAQGKKLVYEYAVNGKTMTKTAQKGSREQIEAALSAIWNEKYAGAMKAQSETFAGMMSNLSDQWMQFKVAVMRAGLFDFLKSRLQMVLDRVNAMAKSGELQRWARDVSTRFMEVAKKVESIATTIWEKRGEIIGAFKATADAIVWAKDALGGWDNLAKAIVIGSQASLIASFLSLGVQIGKVAWQSIAVLPKLAAHLYGVQGAAAGLALGLGTVAAALATFVAAYGLASTIIDENSWLPDWIGGALAGDTTAGMARTSQRGYRAPTVRRAAAPAGGQVNGRVAVDVTLNQNGELQAKLRQALASGGTLETSVDNGAMAAGGY